MTPSRPILSLPNLQREAIQRQIDAGRTARLENALLLWQSNNEKNPKETQKTAL